MIECPRCENREIGLGDRYCKICGLHLGGSEAKQAEESRTHEIIGEQMAAEDMTAILEEELKLLDVRERRAKERVIDPAVRQRILTALEARRCLLLSSGRVRQ